MKKSWKTAAATLMAVVCMTGCQGNAKTEAPAAAKNQTAAEQTEAADTEELRRAPKTEEASQEKGE